MAIDANKVYHVMNGNATTRRMNLYSSGSVSNGMNVVLYDNDDSNEQKWYFDGERFFPESGTGSSYHKFCLDRYTASTYRDNADIWEATAADAAAQVVEVIKYGYYQRVRLKTKIKNASNEEVYYYLTAGANANGTGSGKSAGVAGNIYWAEEITTGSQAMRQNWIFTEVGSSSGGNSEDTDSDIKIPSSKYTYICQRTYPWVNNNYNITSSRFKDYGCAAAAATMFMQIMANDPTIVPEDLFEWGVITNSEGYPFATWNTAGASVSYTFNKVADSWDSTARSNIYNEINSGRPVMIHLNGPNNGTHFVVGYGLKAGTTISNMTNDKIYVLDPWTEDNKTLKNTMDCKDEWANFDNVRIAQ